MKELKLDRHHISEDEEVIVDDAQTLKELVPPNRTGKSAWGRLWRISMTGSLISYHRTLKLRFRTWRWKVSTMFVV